MGIFLTFYFSVRLENNIRLFKRKLHQILGLTVAIYKSELFKRPQKKYTSPESWSDDEGSMSVGSESYFFKLRSYLIQNRRYLIIS